MEPVFRRSGFTPPKSPLARRLLVYFPSGAYTDFSRISERFGRWQIPA
jgi:hypothetical protein